MRKCLNGATLIGRIYQHTLENKVSQKGVNYIGGDIEIATDDAGLNVVKVTYVYVAPTYPAKDGKPERPNPTYATLQKIIDGGKTILVDGADAATKVRLTPSLAVNDFPNREGEMVSAKRLEGGFVTILSTLPDEKERNRFEADCLISGTQLIEADPERNIAEDYLVVRGNVFNWAKAIMPIEFHVKSTGGIQYFESLEASSSNPIFTKIWGQILSSTTVVKREEESAFGEPSIKEYTRTSREWVITGAAQETYEIGDAETGITADEIKEALANRQVHLAEVKKNAEEYAANRAASTPAPAANTAAAGSFSF